MPHKNLQSQQQQQQLQGNNQLPQQYMQHQLSSQPSQTSKRSTPQIDRINGGIMTDGSMSNTSRGNDQVSFHSHLPLVPIDQDNINLIMEAPNVKCHTTQWTLQYVSIS